MSKDEFIKSPIKVGKKFDNLIMPFNYYKQSLYFNKNHKIYHVCHSCEKYLVDIKVREQPTPHNDLEVGKWYVSVHSRYNNLSENIASKCNYELYLGGGESVSLDRDLDIIRADISDSYDYHEVVEDTEE